MSWVRAVLCWPETPDNNLLPWWLLAWRLPWWLLFVFGRMISTAAVLFGTASSSKAAYFWDQTR